VDIADGPPHGTPPGTSHGTPRGPTGAVHAAAGGGGDAAGVDSATAAGGAAPIDLRLKAVILAGRFHGTELDPAEFRLADGETEPSAASLSRWVQASGMWARAVRLRWRHLMRFQDTGPVVLLFNDGSAGLLTGANEENKVVYLKDPATTSDAAVAVDELRLAQVWSGDAVLMRANRGAVEADEPFTLRWLSRLVLTEKKSLRDIGIGSITLSVLSILPPFIVMSAIDKVLTHHSYSTLMLLVVIMTVMVVYQTVLEYARRLIVAIVGTRLDARLNLHVFNRMLRLPLDYFERVPAGDTLYRISQVGKIREFFTGRLLTTFLDFITLLVLLPFLFWLNTTLAWLVLACACLLTLVIFAFIRPMRAIYAEVTRTETNKSIAMTETIYGVKTIKSLALEPQRRFMWDQQVAEAGAARLAFQKMANWPQTLVTPIERFMWIGVILIGVYLAMADAQGYLVGGLFAFIMLSQRVAQPLVSMARLIESFEEVTAAIGEVASVLNRPLETDNASGGLRPRFAGAITFEDVTFTYLGTKVPAIDRVSFSIKPGTMLGVVGRSGSGKSTLTRLLQGVTRDYSGFVKIDGNDLREINLRHLRTSLGVVLQDNFLFRGTIRENILSGRPGLTTEDAVRAARLAGAEEFIERMPNGYETFIQEGSSNLSGGQKQRLAIARALISDPRILILDEATSALDPESEALVNANLLRIGRNRTMVIVSHRLSSLVECDQIMVLERGGIVDIAPHQTLLERCSLYRQLWSQQNRHLESQGSRHATATPTLLQGD
jgi:subfamily B ATP-binding cassette protein HlyB/CyaB